MKIVDKRSMSEDSPIKTMAEHIDSIELREPYQVQEITLLVQRVFDTCIAVAEEEAADEALRNRYKSEEVRGAQRMAESIAGQLRDLRG